jgi:nitroreductase
MDNLELLKLRRSVRVFKKEDIPRNELEKIIDAARYAPTARNVQPWEFVVIAKKDILKELAGMIENARFMDQAAACLAVFCRQTKYYLEDGCAATCNILLAATALGIGSCWVAGDKKSYSGQVNTLLNAPNDMKLISLIALGYPQDKHAFRGVDKRQLKELIHWERF